MSTTADIALTAVKGWLYDQAQAMRALADEPAARPDDVGRAMQRRNQAALAAHLTGAVAHLAVYRADVLAVIETAITESSEADSP